ncbi:BtrH N-terminal domain-containing protein [Paenibacillus sp. 481]|uniref:BtrH N-terminal domain-containing protein n=1 Tax=Paenibacillus sp. 481 TaxID=2835869 RepID=UPI001E636ABE|nr:BtrH N-terminal domain-containing protein [Paenibacillus sp. 481]UHA73556.1 hypothetical protein KIK04_23915 [Paenibacillus sp. 481]
MSSAVYLDDIVMKRESKSFTDSLYAVLTAAHLFEGPKYMLSGLSGMAFKFTVHEQLLPMSVTAYGQWGITHQPAVDNLGVYTVSDSGRTRHPTFNTYQQEAIKWVKESLDSGIGVIYWIPEFGVIHGYDDADQVFFVLNGWSDESQVLLYDNFGVNDTPFWYCQLVGGKVEVDRKEMVLESLRLAITDWETPYRTLPYTDIASGRLAYSYLIRALEQGQYHESGAVYILNAYRYSRMEIMAYLRDVHDLFKDLREAYDMYKQLVHDISAISSCFVTTGQTEKIDLTYIPKLTAILQAAKQYEEQAIEQFKMVSDQYPDLKRFTVPRWGSHAPR